MREQSKGSFLDRISEAAWRHANETAIEFGSHGVSYAELDRRSNAVAAAIAAMSLSHNSLIALMMRRSDEMLVGALGILKAGHAYIPIDPAFPEDRVAYMISHSDAQAIVVDAASAAPHGPGVYRTYSELEQEGRGLPLPVVVRNDDDLAYVIYTSGSTGTPKGVMVPVSSVCNFLDSMAVAPGLSQQDVLLAVTTFSFDIAVLELFLPLTVGARVVIADETCVDDGAKLADLMSQCNATVMQATPATWRMLLASDWQGKKDLKVLCGGEAAPPELMAELCACTAEVWNMYGPTETTIWSSCYRVPAGAQQIYLGPPIASTQLYVVDENGSEVGTSEPGELYIGGEGLATGYLKDETQTRERFVKAPQLCSDGLLYRTGDLVSRDAEGNIAFIGRLDNQVKIRGYRIELGEIESALRAHPDVAQAAVITANIDGDKCLVAYITSESGEPPALASLRTVVDSKLPYYMMPQYFVALPELPLTPNRKIDRKALPGIDDVVPISDAEFVAASTEVEKAIRDIWCDVLHLEDVGIHSDFFHIGGHSLTATRVWSRLKSRLGINLSLKTVFEISTISGLAKEVAEVRETDAADTGIPVISRMKRPEMSVAQQRFWYIDQLAGDLPLYNLCASFRFKGNLDQGALNNALNAIIARHEILRTQLVWEEGRPLQAIKPALKYALESDDLSALGEKEAYDELMAKMQTRIKRKVLLDQTPAFDACLYRLSSDDHVLFFMPHHVIWDGWSFDVFLSELKAFYEEEIGQKEADLPELPIQYADFAEWHRKQVEDETFSSQLEYWEEVLGNELPLLNLPTDYARPQQFGFEGRTKYVKFGAPVIVAVGELARQNRTTVNVVVLALYYGLLHRYTGQDDIIIGSPIQGRLAEETENLIGLFVNTVPIRVSLAGNPTINELVCRVRDTALEAYQNQEVPIEKLVEMYAGDADASRPPLFQTLFTHQEVSERNTRIGDLEMSQINLHNGSCPAEISFWLKSSPTVLAGAMEFSTDLFSPERVDRMLNHLMNFFASGASSPDTHVSDVIYIDDSEYSHIHQELNDTAADRANGKDLAALLAETASAHASDTALCYRDTTLTYTELHKQADQIARLLHDEVKADRAVVGICMSRSPMMLASMLACWKAGYAYLPLDADNPTERNGYIVDNAGASVILAEQELHDLSSSWNVPVLCCDSEPVQQRMAALPQDTALPEVDDESLAYVIYTSGSTGVPKGVALPRSSVRNFLLSIANKPGISSSDVVLAITTITFDIHVLELFVPLIVGAKIVLLESEDAADGFRLAETLERFDVSIMQATPSTWHLLDATEWSGKSDLKALVGGEAVPASLVDAIEPKVRELWNMYGPTETTVWSTCCTMKAGQKPLIGTPIDNTQVFILDAAHQPVGVGVPGDLYICGDGLARGYYKDEEKTRGSFFEIDVDGPRRAYRTGDIALVTESGDLEYVSRADDQVKVRGYRIELGEIESALLKVDNIALTAARILNPGTDDARIVGYFVKEQRKSLSQPKIRKVLRHYLPHYMVPQHLVELEEIPLTPNGKVDRKNLPAPGGSSAAEESKQPPRSEQEKQVAAIWSELIGIDNIGRHDNFFTIGGHSLLSMKFIAQLRRQTSANIHVRDVVLGDLAQIARLLPETAKAAEPADAGIMGRYT